MDTIPVFVREGGIIPTDPKRRYSTEVVTEPVTLHVFPGCGATFSLYDDDGSSMDYQTPGTSAASACTSCVASRLMSLLSCSGRDLHDGYELWHRYQRLPNGRHHLGLRCVMSQRGCSCAAARAGAC
jgi:hypothetical protein